MATLPKSNDKAAYPRIAVPWKGLAKVVNIWDYACDDAEVAPEPFYPFYQAWLQAIITPLIINC